MLPEYYHDTEPVPFRLKRSLLTLPDFKSVTGEKDEGMNR